MAILDPNEIPGPIKDQIDAAANSLGLAQVHLQGGGMPDPTDIRVLMLSEAYQRALTAIAMMILDEPLIL